MSSKQYTICYAGGVEDLIIDILEERLLYNNC
jgi:hypothetical protein